jgi:hypothetical protein
MLQLSAKERREILDWIIFGLSGKTLYGDARDAPPTDCDEYFIEEWHGKAHAARLRRRRLEALSDQDLLHEGYTHLEEKQWVERLVHPKRGRPVGAGSLERADQPFLDEIHNLMAEGLSLHAASQVVALGAPGGGTPLSKARRLERRILEKKSE